MRHDREVFFLLFWIPTLSCSFVRWKYKLYEQNIIIVILTTFDVRNWARERELRVKIGRREMIFPCSASSFRWGNLFWHVRVGSWSSPRMMNEPDRRRLWWWSTFDNAIFHFFISLRSLSVTHTGQEGGKTDDREEIAKMWHTFFSLSRPQENKNTHSLIDRIERSLLNLRNRPQSAQIHFHYSQIERSDGR